MKCELVEYPKFSMMFREVSKVVIDYLGAYKLYVFSKIIL